MSTNVVDKIQESLVEVTAGRLVLEGTLSVPEGARAVVLFAHGSGSSRNSPRNRYVARILNQERLATLLVDLLTAEERVAAAIANVATGRDFSVEQAKWLDYIRQHLIANLSIDREDFDTVPVLSNRGGWGRANKVFEGALADLLDALNKELVAA